MLGQIRGIGASLRVLGVGEVVVIEVESGAAFRFSILCLLGVAHERHRNQLDYRRVEIVALPVVRLDLVSVCARLQSLTKSQ